MWTSQWRQEIWSQLAQEENWDCLIVGGGIRRPERAWASAEAGADIIVVGNAVEKSASLLTEMAEAVHSCRAGGLHEE